jgi:Fe-S-cluster-containing hydrogenase component 2
MTQSVADYLGAAVGEANRAWRACCAAAAALPRRRGRVSRSADVPRVTAVTGGGKACVWGCLSLADCEVACAFDAIVMNAAGLPVVIPERCTACGDCVTACPKDLFVLMPVEHKLIVQCRSLLEGEAAERLCRVACNACGKCVVDAAPGVIEIRNGLAVVDYARNELADPEATRRCPTGAIVWVEGAQLAPGRPGPVPQRVEEAVA